MLCWGIVVLRLETPQAAALCWSALSLLGVWVLVSALVTHHPSRHCIPLLQGTYALNSNKGKRERIGRIQLMHANNREDIKVRASRSFGALVYGEINDIWAFN